MIWQLATPPGRRIFRFRVEDVLSCKDRARAFEPLRIPSIMHICRESRTEGQKLYTLGFGLSPFEKGQDYWQPDIDIVYFPRWLPLKGWQWQRNMPFDFSHHLRLGCKNIRNNVFAINCRSDGIEPCHSLIGKARDLAISCDHFICKLLLNGLEGALAKSSFTDAKGGARSVFDWLAKFEHLEFLTLVIDRGPLHYRTGNITLPEPDVDFRSSPIVLSTNILGMPLKFVNSFEITMTPAYIENEMNQILQAYITRFKTDWAKPPTVQLRKIQHHNQPPDFCIPPPVFKNKCRHYVTKIGDRATSSLSEDPFCLPGDPQD